ncbi:MAG TPA: ATP-dependent helicase HrpB, partial [Nitrospirota bacterium]
AVSAARWMARSLGEQPGETIGYTIRFDTKTSEKTRIEVVTEGVLTRRIQSDPGLESASIVIFDEFHERSIHADLALALCLDIRKELRSDMKILVMSATLDPGPVSALLGGAPIISSTGRVFPVEERYFEDHGRSLPARVTSAVRTALKETNGDLLVFLPGAGEIRACAGDLQTSLDMNEERLSLHPLYGDLPFEEQERAILPSRDRRKIVLATNIAETSLTIEGVHVVIDSGLTRMLRYDASSGMNRLVTGMVSRASADQRKGRAGRLGPGMCYRLYGSHDLREMLPFTLPEIMVSDLSNLCLELAVWGVTDPSKLSWIDEPPAGAWDSAQGLLLDLGALDGAGRVTPLGRLMVRFPLHPRLSRLMLRAQELGCVRLGADLAALITERDLFRVSAGERMIREPDISERVEALRRGRKGRDQDERADPSALRAVERTANQLMRLMSGTMERASNETVDPELISRLLLSAYPDRIGKRRDEGGGRYVLAQGRGVRLSLDSHLLNNRYLIAVAVDAGEGTEGFVHVAAPVSEEMIRGECAGRIKIVKRTEWDRKEGRIIAANEERLGALLLSIRPFAPADDEAEPILCDAIKTMPGLLSFSAEARQLQSRVG